MRGAGAAWLMVMSLTVAGLLAGGGGRELIDVSLLETLGVDGPGPVTVTAVGEDGAVWSARGEDLLAAQEGLKGLGRQRLEVTHVAQVVLGETAEVGETLWEEVTHRDSGYGARVWLCRGEAAELLARGEEIGKRLKSLEENGGVKAPTLLEALGDLSRTGGVTLPVVELEKGEAGLAGYERVEGELPCG